MIDIYWKIEGSGFYALEYPADGYIHVGHDEHLRLIEATMNGSQIAMSDDSSKLVLLEPVADDE